MRIAAPSNMAPTTNPLFTFDEPLDRIDTSRIHLLLGPDSAAVERPFKLVDFPHKLTQLMLMGEWRPNQQYQLRVDSAAFYSLSGRVNQSTKLHINIADPETFGSIFFVLQGPGSDSALVQIFTDEKKYTGRSRLIGVWLTSIMSIREVITPEPLSTSTETGNGTPAITKKAYNPNLFTTIPDSFSYGPAGISIRTGT